MVKFWWSGSLDRSSLHWVAWDKLASPKARGGMGFRDLELFNLSLFGKHGWRFITNPNLLCARGMKGRYFPDGEFMDAAVPRSSSAMWRAIVAGREALQTGLVKWVGRGSSISVWEDKWIPSTVTMSPMLRPAGATVQIVDELIDTDSWSWRRDVVRESSLHRM